jgi:hypothetical protein
MLLRTNSDLFDTVEALAGVNDFTTEEKANLVDLANRRAVMAYNTSPMWDRYVVVGSERNVSSFEITGGTFENGLYFRYGKSEYTTGKFNDVFTQMNAQNSSARSYVMRQNSDGKWILGAFAYSRDPQTDIVTYTSGTVVATQVDNGILSSPTEVKEWTFTGSLSNLFVNRKQVVPYEDVHESNNSSTVRVLREQIIDFIRIHKDQAFLNQSTTEYDFYADSDGANILNITSGTHKVFVTFKKRIDPQNNPSKGVLISSYSIGNSVPGEFFNYIAHGTYADFLRMDGQHDKAAFEEQKADMFLATELERIDIINNNNSLNHKFSTYVNRSIR